MKVKTIKFVHLLILITPFTLLMNLIFFITALFLSIQYVRQNRKLRIIHRYNLLQTSLDHFSNELFGVMKVVELNERLIHEVRHVLQVNSVWIVEVDRNLNILSKHDEIDVRRIKKIIDHYDSNIPPCEVHETQDSHLIKIADARGRDYVLIIEGPRSLLPPEEVWLKTISRYVNVLYDNFRVIEEFSEEINSATARHEAPTWLLRVLFNLTEKERKRLSQDLHDGALQELIIWYRKMKDIMILSDVSEHLRQELYEISEGLMDVIYEIRLACNELRPPMLKELGLVSSLETLFESLQRRLDYEIIFDSTRFHSSLSDEQLIGLYRIVQELLANAAKHANAETVYITLTSQADNVILSYRDNGIGISFNIEEMTDGMGIYGIKERVRSLEGHIEFHSVPSEGLHITISIPVHAHQI